MEGQSRTMPFCPGSRAPAIWLLLMRAWLALQIIAAFDGLGTAPAGLALMTNEFLSIKTSSPKPRSSKPTTLETKLSASETSDNDATTFGSEKATPASLHTMSLLRMEE